jgi:hypothetical protein
MAPLKKPVNMPSEKDSGLDLGLVFRIYKKA